MMMVDEWWGEIAVPAACGNRFRLVSTFVDGGDGGDEPGVALMSQLLRTMFPRL